MSMGFLFMSGGLRSFSSSKEATAALVISLFPRFPVAPTDNRWHLQASTSRADMCGWKLRILLVAAALQVSPRCTGGQVLKLIACVQAFRHLYVLATEPRCLAAVDVQSRQPVFAPVAMHLQKAKQAGAAPSSVASVASARAHACLTGTHRLMVLAGEDGSKAPAAPAPAPAPAAVPQQSQALPVAGRLDPVHPGRQGAEAGAAQIMAPCQLPDASLVRARWPLRLLDMPQCRQGISTRRVQTFNGSS